MLKIQQQLAERLGKALAKSALDDETKEIILENAGKLPEQGILKLLDVLQAERKDMDMASFDLDLFLKKQDANWAKATEEQKKAADIICNKWLMKLS